MKPEPDDDALMARTGLGEEEAFRLLVLRWEKSVLAFMVHMLGSVEEAEDLVQDTFVKVLQKAPGYQGQGLFRSWLFRIAGNLARSALRRRKILRWVRFEQGAHELPAVDAGPLDRLEREQKVALLQTAVARLPARQREALVLHRFQGLKYSEVALAMDTTIPGVESLLQRALAGLKKQMVQKVKEDGKS